MIDGYDRDHDDDDGVRQSDENMLVMRLTSLIFEMTNENGSSGTRARLFWPRLKTLVPPCSHILARKNLFFKDCEISRYRERLAGRYLAERASTWKGVR